MSQAFKLTGILALAGSLGTALIVGCGAPSSTASDTASAAPLPPSSAVSQIRCKGKEFVLRTKLTSQRCSEAGVTEEVWSYETAILGSTELLDVGAATFFCDQDKRWATMLSAVTGNRMRLDARRNGTYDLSQVGFYLDTLSCDARF
jgi:hypothetical protein